MIPYRGTKVELDDGRELVVPAFFYKEARKHSEQLRSLEGEAAESYVAEALVELVKRNHPDFTSADLEQCSMATVWDLWGAGMRTKNEGTVPGEARRAK